MAAIHPLDAFMPSTTGFHYVDYPYYWIARTEALYARQMEKILKPLGIDMHSRRVLMVLQIHGMNTVSQLAERSTLKLPTLTRILQRLKASGLIATCTSAQDARVTEVTITEQGLQCVHQIHEATRNVFAKSYEGMTDTQLRQLMALLEQITGNLRKP